MKKVRKLWLAYAVLSVMLMVSMHSMTGICAGEGVDALIEQLQSEEDYERVRAAVGIGDMGEEGAGAVPLLVETLQDENNHVSKAAAGALGNIGLPAVPALEEILRDDESPEMRELAAISLMGMGTEATEAASGLVLAMGDPVDKVSSAAEAAAVEAQIDYGEHFNELIEHVESDVEELGMMAGRSLGIIATVGPAELHERTKNVLNELAPEKAEYIVAGLFDMLEDVREGSDVRINALNVIYDDGPEVAEIAAGREVWLALKEEEEFFAEVIEALGALAVENPIASDALSQIAGTEKVGLDARLFAVEMDPNPELEVLSQLAQNEDVGLEYRTEVFDLLGGLTNAGGEEALSVLLNVLKDTEDTDEVRLAALDVLGEQADSDKEIVLVLLDILKDTDDTDEIRLEVMDVLKELVEVDEEKVAAGLLNVSNDVEDITEVRMTGFDVLWTSDFVESEELAPVFLGILEETEDADEVRLTALDVLGEQADSDKKIVLALLDILKDTEDRDEIRLEVISALKELVEVDEEKVAAGLLNVLKNAGDITEVRMKAFDVLWTSDFVESEELASVFLDILGDTEDTDSVRLTALDFLGEQPAFEREIAPILFDILKDTEDADEVRLTALDFLGEQADSDQEIVPILLDILKDTEDADEIRMEVIAALNELVDVDEENMATGLLNVLKDAEDIYEVRMKALDILWTSDFVESAELAPVFLDILGNTEDADEVRLAVLDVLGEQEDFEQEIVPVLVAILQDGEEPLTVSRNAAHALGRIGGEKAQQARETDAHTDWLMSHRDNLRSRGGLAVFLGDVENLAPARELVDSGPWTIHWLAPDASAVREARRTLRETGSYGHITVEQWEQSSLPYADNLVNLIIADRSEMSVEDGELSRVLAPRGSAFINDGNDRAYLKKQRPDEMGEWTHPYHDAGGSLSASDRAFGVPNAFQWIAGPPFPFATRKSSAGAQLSAGGRTFQITQNVVENFPGGGPNYLIARDAYSGTVLWSREWEGPTVGSHRDGAHVGIATCGEKVYGIRERDVFALDASTGEKLSVWSAEGEPNKLLLVGGTLVAQSPEGLTAFDVEEDAMIWHRELDEPWGALAADGRVYCLLSSREKDGQWRHDLTAVDLENGDLSWTREVGSRRGHSHVEGIRLHFAGEGVVCLIEREELHFLCAVDGRKLWQHEASGTARGGHDSRMGGHFIIDGEVLIRDRSGSNTYKVFHPRSGEMLRKAVDGGWTGSLPSCQPLVASSRFVFKSGKSGTEVWDFETGEGARAEFVRGGCRIGASIANGMAYIPPHACGCGSEWYRGNLAIVSSEDPGINTTQPGSLQKGPAYGEVNAPENGLAPGAWPMYRRDGRRSSYLPQDISPELKEEWENKIGADEAEGDGEWRLNFGHRLSPPVVAGGMLMLANPQTHQVIALDKNSGEKNWQFTAGGRVSSPPTIHGELVLFGSHDGYVYALRGSDGELLWRRRAAPSDRRIMAYGQVESAWPVRNVLVHDGVALAAAGRAADAGGGAVVHAFEPATGEFHWSSRIEPNQARNGKPDLLVTDGENVYLMNKRIDTETGETSGVNFRRNLGQREWSGAEQPRLLNPDGIRYLRSGKAGFFETSWTKLAIGLRKHQSSWNWGESGGEMIAFTPDIGYAFQLDVGNSMWRGPRPRGGGQIEVRAGDEADLQWLHEIPNPAQVEAMFVAENALFVAGPNDRGNPVDGGGFLRIINLDGTEIAEIELPAPPVHDGMAAADGRVFLTLKDGSVTCLRGD